VSDDELTIEHAWFIECWRCVNNGAHDGPRDEALADFAKAGWRKDSDGYQLCPQC